MCNIMLLIIVLVWRKYLYIEKFANYGNHYKTVQLTVELHPSGDALIEPASLTDLFQILGITSNRTRAAVATLVIPVHLDCPPEEALASLTADDAIVTPKRSTRRRHVVTHHTRRTGHGRFVVLRVVRGRRSDLIGQAIRRGTHSVLGTVQSVAWDADHGDSSPSSTLSQLRHGDGAAISVAHDGTHRER